MRQTPAVKRGDHAPRCCEHGEWTFAGTEYKRQATKWRCPTGECQPKSTWVKADRLHPLIPRHTERSKALYSSRGAVEREFGRLKHEWALLPLACAASSVCGCTPTSRSRQAQPGTQPSASHEIGGDNLPIDTLRPLVYFRTEPEAVPDGAAPGSGPIS